MRSGVSYTLDNREVLRGSSVVILGIKPQVFSCVVGDLSSLFEGKLVISLVAGVSVDSLREFCGCCVVRVMSNTAVELGRGVSVYSCSEGVGVREEELVGDLFGSLGLVRRVDECQLDLITAVSGSGPAFFFKYVEEMINAAVKLGLDRDLALDLVVGTVAGSVAMIEQKVGSVEDLGRAVTSSGGTTYAGLERMRELCFEELVFEVLRVSKERSFSLGEEIKDSLE